MKLKLYSIRLVGLLWIPGTLVEFIAVEECTWRGIVVP